MHTCEWEKSIGLGMKRSELFTSAISSLLLEEMPSTSNLKNQKTKHQLDFIRSPGPWEKINENIYMLVQLLWGLRELKETSIGCGAHMSWALFYNCSYDFQTMLWVRLSPFYKGDSKLRNERWLVQSHTTWRWWTEGGNRSLWFQNSKTFH